MGRPILVRGARQLLTLRGPAGPRRGRYLRELGVLPDGSVLILDGLIHQANVTRRIENLALARDAIEINAAGKVVMPGFVDSHTHLISGAPRLADFEAMIAGVRASEAAAHRWEIELTSGSTLERQAAKILDDCVREGTTTLEAKSGFGVSEAGELKILRTYAALHEHPVSIVSTAMLSASFAGGGAQGYQERLLPVVQRRRLAEFVDVECEDDAYRYHECRGFLQAARQLGFGLKIHSGQRSATRAAELAMETGAISIDHAIHIDEHQTTLLANIPTVATLLPGSVFYLGGERYAQARRLIDAGVAVALASNYNSRTCPSHNMQMMIGLACRAMRMSPAEAISAATINGAHALRRAHRIGSIEEGKDADLLILAVPDYRELPYHFGVNLVEQTIRRGQVIYRRGSVATALS